jgi:hypothetical protein
MPFVGSNWILLQVILVWGLEISVWRVTPQRFFQLGLAHVVTAQSAGSHFSNSQFSMGVLGVKLPVDLFCETMGSVLSTSFTQH